MKEFTVVFPPFHKRKTPYANLESDLNVVTDYVKFKVNGKKTWLISVEEDGTLNINSLSGQPVLIEPRDPNVLKVRQSR